MTTVNKGTIKWYNSQKGYGFIKPDDNSTDVFVHTSDLERSGISRLDEGMKVSYSTLTRKGKTSATDIKILSKPA